jgi:phospholipid/cholesterol/gamma-HCH transport system permease protein
MTTTDSATSVVKQANKSLAELGDVGRWIVRTILELPRALKYPTEIIRQTAILLFSNALPIWAMLFTFGVFLSEIGYYVLLQIGAQAYTGLFANAGSLKATSPVFFGFIVAAKTGTGYVAEIGAMRINEEIDALEVLGIDSKAYLIGTRLWASLIALPMLYITGMAICFLTTGFGSVHVYHAVSEGGFWRVFWSFASPFDIGVGSMGWAMIAAVIAVIVGLYYGYNASGGAVGVGENAAKSMSLNVVVVALLSGMYFQAVYGTGVVLPIGN